MSGDLAPCSATPEDSTIAVVLFADVDGRKGEGPEILGVLSHGLGGGKQPETCSH